MNKKGVSITSIIIILILVAVVLIAVGIIYVIVNGIINPPLSENKYCVEWNYRIYRENMIFNCFDFADQRFGCLWYIDKNQILHIYEGTNDLKVARDALNDLWKDIDDLKEVGNYTCTGWIWKNE